MRESNVVDYVRVSSDMWTFEKGGTGERFVPVGCNYYDAHTGWPPAMWRDFHPARIRQDFRRMQDLGVNAIRVWLQWKSFMPQRGKISPKGLDRCRTLLSFAGETGIRVNLTGPEFWEGAPSWLSDLDLQGYQHLVNPEYQSAHELFWGTFAELMKNEQIVYAYDLINEPFMPWDGKDMRRLWNRWIRNRYSSKADLRAAWGSASPSEVDRGDIPPPPNRRVPGSRYLMDYQIFREEHAVAWIKRTTDAIRNVNPLHLITVGLHQSSSPFEEIVPSRYTAFNPRLLGKHLDYVSLHWYPFGNPFTAASLPFDLEDNMTRSLSVFLMNCRYCYAGKPLVMEEFSYYGGGSPQFWGGVLPYRTEMEQAEFSSRLLSVSEGSIGGWLNWPLQDTKGSADTSAFGGFYSANGSLKEWGETFRNLSGSLRMKRLSRRGPSRIIPITRTVLLTDAQECDRIAAECCRLFKEGIIWDFHITD